MQAEDKIALSKLRLETARECLTAADALILAGSYKGAANRSYYAVFHAMRAVLVFDEFDSKKHSGIISEFRRLYIKTGIFSSEISTIISAQFYTRSHSDYDDFYVISKSEAIENVDNSKKMVDAVEEYLKSRY